MALFNEILVGRFNRAVQKLFSMKGPAALSQVSSELQMNMNFGSGVENRYLEGWDRYAIAKQQAAVAANQSGLRYRNPAGSNVIAVFEKLAIRFANGQAATQVSIQSGTTSLDLATVIGTAGAGLDSRGRPASTLILSQQASAVTVPLLAGNNPVDAYNATGFLNVEAIINEHQEIPLLPGQALQFVNDIVNTQLLVVAWWRERYLEDSERT